MNPCEISISIFASVDNIHSKVFYRLSADRVLKDVNMDGHRSRFLLMRARLTAILLAVFLFSIVASASVSLRDFNLQDLGEKDVVNVGNIVKVGCSSGYVRFRGKCRKAW